MHILNGLEKIPLRRCATSNLTILYSDFSFNVFPNHSRLCITATTERKITGKIVPLYYKIRKAHGIDYFVSYKESNYVIC